MEENTSNTEVTVKKVRGVPFVKGEDPRRNITGRPQGALDFKTKWAIFIDKVAKEENLTPQEIDEQLLRIGLKKAKEGDYQFYRDIQDRLHGKPLNISVSKNLLQDETIDIYPADYEELNPEDNTQDLLNDGKGT